MSEPDTSQHPPASDPSEKEWAENRTEQSKFEAAESGKRTRRLATGIVTAAFARATAALAPLVTVPWALDSLGFVGYGAWSAALSLTALAAYADLGLGASIMTIVPAAIARGDYSEARQAISSAYVTLIALAATLCGALWLSSGLVDWSIVVGGKSGDPATQSIVVVTLTAFILNIVAFLINRVQQAAQAIAASQVWQTAGSVVGIAAMFGAVSLRLPGAYFVAVAAFTPAAVALINTAWFFCRDITGRKLRPSFRTFNVQAAHRLLGVGTRYLLIYGLMAMSLGIDTWIVAQTSDLAEVPNYAVPARVMAVVGTIVMAISAPFWPTSAHAMAVGDLAWLKRATRRLTVLSTTLTFSVSCFAVLLGPPLIGWWLGGRISAGPLLIAGLALVQLVQAMVGPAFMVQNGYGRLKPQTVGYTVLLLAQPAKWWVSSEFGFVWLPYVTAMSYLAIIVPAAILGYVGTIRSVEAQREIRAVAC